MRGRLAFIAVLAVATALGFPGIATAEDGPETELPEFFDGVRAGGAGSSHTAVASGFESLYQNPAGVARAPMYVLDGAFSYTPQGALLTGGIADSKINPNLAAGVGASYFIGQGDHDNLSGLDIRGAVGIPVVPEQVSVGAGVRYLRITDTDIQTEGPEAEEDDQLLIHGVTIDAGVNFRATDMLHLGLKGENLIDHCADDDACRGATPTRISGGIGLGDETGFMFSGDVAVDLTSSADDTPLIDFGAGIEHLVGGTMPIRAGFQRRAFLDRNLVTLGGGWRSEEIGFDMAYRHDINRATEFGYASASFSVYF